MKLYDKIKKMLEDNVEYRNSDKKLIWAVWSLEVLPPTVDGMILSELSYAEYLSVTSCESIRRARQMIQHNCPELCPTSERVKRNRRKIQAQKGTFVYRETLL